MVNVVEEGSRFEAVAIAATHGRRRFLRCRQLRLDRPRILEPSVTAVAVFILLATSLMLRLLLLVERVKKEKSAPTSL